MEPGQIKTIVSESIAQLLLRHNCVIIPHLGGFIGNYTPSKIMIHTNKVVPPSKALLFNNNLVNNDGLLIQHLAEENRCSYQDAQRTVEQFVSLVRNDLKEGNRYEVERVGFLFLQSDQQIGFEQDHSFNLYMNSFGLGSVRFVTFEETSATDTKAPTLRKIEEERPKAIKTEPNKVQPVHKEETLEKSKETFAYHEKPSGSHEKNSELREDVIRIDFKKPKEKEKQAAQKNVSNDEQPKKSYNWRRYVAAAAVLPIVFYSLWIPMKSDVLKTKILQIEDFNPFYSTPDEQYESRLEVTSHDLQVWEPETIDFSKVAKGTKNYNIPFVNGKMIAVAMEVKENKVEKEKVAMNNKPFHLIAGCFGSKANAESLIDQLEGKGFNAFIVDHHKGLYRVSALQTDSKQSAIDQKSKLESAGFSNWVLEK